MNEEKHKQMSKTELFIQKYYATPADGVSTRLYISINQEIRHREQDPLL